MADKKPTPPPPYEPYDIGGPRWHLPVILICLGGLVGAAWMHAAEHRISSMEQKIEELESRTVEENLVYYDR